MENKTSCTDAKMSKFSNSEIGSHHWSATVLSFIMRVGEFMSDEKNTDHQYYTEWGAQIKERAVEINDFIHTIPEGYKEKATEDLRKEIDLLRQTNKKIYESRRKYMAGFDERGKEIERLTQSNKELVEALKTAHQYMMVFIIRGEEPLVGENLKTDSYTVLNLIEKSKP
jgi:hypothetical protein